MLKRIAMLSAHTSPLEQPGTGDAGGMNVYVLELSRQLAARGIEVEIFTRATSRHQPPLHEAGPGILVRHVAAGPFEGLQKNDLPSQMCSFVRDVLRVEVERAPGHFDLVHSHYWLSGQIGMVARERWGVPLVHTMHTMAKVKNSLLAVGDVAEPIGRIAAEEEIVRLADRLIANTAQERRRAGRALRRRPAARRRRASRRRPRRVPQRSPARGPTSPGSPRRRGPAAVRRSHPAAQGARRRHRGGGAAARARPVAARTAVVASSAAPPAPASTTRRLTDLSSGLGLDDVVTLRPHGRPARARRLVRRGRRGLRALAQRVLRAGRPRGTGLRHPRGRRGVGGLATAVVDGVTGVLVDGHDPADYAAALHPLLVDPELRAAHERQGRAARRVVRLGRHGRAHPRRLRRGRAGVPAEEDTGER